MYTYYPYINNNGTINNFGEADAMKPPILKLHHYSTNPGRKLPAAEREEDLDRRKEVGILSWRFSGNFASVGQPR